MVMTIDCRITFSFLCFYIMACRSYCFKIDDQAYINSDASLYLYVHNLIFYPMNILTFAL